MDAIILAGGKGTRLQSVVSDVPKPLAPVSGRPFLDYQLALLAAAGSIDKVVLAIGHLADRVVDHYTRHSPPLPVAFQQEKTLLGTGGGLRNALAATSSDPILALNGDSVFRWRLSPMVEALQNPEVSCVMGLVRIADTARYGAVELTSSGRIAGFSEKGTNTGSGLINAGLYLFRRNVLETIPLGENTSLETDVFPKLAQLGQLAGVAYDSPFIDIGLPETYSQAARVLDAIEQTEVASST